MVKIAHVAFRVLGKFGGGNRKMMIEPQALEFREQEQAGLLNIPSYRSQKLQIPFFYHKYLDEFILFS